MAKVTVLRSINHPDGSICVDIFRRPDGSHGYQTCRRDPEDPRGWYILGPHVAEPYATEAEAASAAQEAAPWMAEP